ncbi:cytochrome c [Paracoccus sp. S1E-3]|uniref:cytochrome c n=1 Tax=Paracoccus sp. S1E-3 TaxID=2756130 RepID=UPI0015EF4FCB|nr:cytochrome c [Paracoccus sp. S1E-3]MBA4489835.1 cytochrome c [Paracoccus sp. S1E-3]
MRAEGILRLLAGLVVLAVLGLAAFLLLARRAEIAPDASAATREFAPELVARGADLAAVGNCVACHTEPGEPAFAGGFDLPTPFGDIFSTNITPDPETGIGNWSLDAFRRAMRQGVDREGNHLYPAFPYDQYTRISDADIEALYAYLMTRPAIRREDTPNELIFPLGFRPVLAGWKFLFFDEGERPVQSDKSEDWNRGAYLAEGLGHCSGCHTPRNAFGALAESRHFDGGEAEGWQAVALNAANPAPIPWTEDSLYQYLHQGWNETHGIAAGPMAEVTANLRFLPDADVRAMAVYLMDQMGTREPRVTDRADLAADRGAELYAGICAQCHEDSKPLSFGGVALSQSTPVSAPHPQNLVNLVMFGLPPADGEAAPIMPPFADALDDADMVTLLTYLRARFSAAPAWQGLDRIVRDTRSGEYPVTTLPPNGIERGPANVNAAGG